MSAQPSSKSVIAIIERWKDEPGGLLPLFHDVQAALGYVPPESLSEIAGALNLSRAEVHGVLSFYHDFRTAPAGRHTVQICQAEACQAVGARALAQRATELLGTEFGSTSDDGGVTLEPVYCLGNCACGPSVRVDNRVHGRVDSERLEALLAACRQREEP
ncbi:MAG: formate dehydrogenase subunit gamma [Halieaceae bacterium]|nr:formate dehydrogenase subunit gamma [Halieaceae bacterium]